MKMRSNIIFPACLLILITLSHTGCDWLYGVLDKEGAEEKELIGEITPYEKNSTVEEVQVLLSLYGYSPGRPDGILGLRTRNAIEKFQKDNGLNPTRFVDQLTSQKLKVFKENGLIEEDRLNVKLVQTLLLQAGYSPGKADGKFGPKTKNAVKNFQKAHTLKVDGKVGYQTLSALSKYFSPQETEPTHIQ